MTFIVCNTGPLIALAAATGDWRILESIGIHAVVPLEVVVEFEAGKAGTPGRGLVATSPWITFLSERMAVPAYLSAALDPGEAAVIACALERGIQTVAIDERVGRAVARSSGLTLTGSLGFLIQARRAGLPVNLIEACDRIRAAGIWISDKVIQRVVMLSEEG